MKIVITRARFTEVSRKKISKWLAKGYIITVR